MSGFPITVLLDGTVRLPLIGRIVAEGKTVDELRDSIKAAYSAKGRTKPTAQIQIALLSKRLARPVEADY